MQAEIEIEEKITAGKGYAYIRMALDERERAQHFTLKLAKKLIDAKYARKKAKAAK